MIKVIKIKKNDILKILTDPRGTYKYHFGYFFPLKDDLRLIIVSQWDKIDLMKINKSRIRICYMI